MTQELVETKTTEIQEEWILDLTFISWTEKRHMNVTVSAGWVNNFAKTFPLKAAILSQVEQQN